MTALLSQVFSLLAAPSGNLIYQVVLVFSVAGALQSSYPQWRSHENPAAQRMALGLAILLGIQLLLIAFSTLSWQGVIKAASSLPPLDRAAALATIVWVIWLWSLSQSTGRADAGAVLLSVLTAVAAVLSVLSWAPWSGRIPYNHTIDDLLWQYASLALLVFGVLLLIIRRPKAHVNGLAFLALAFLGHLAHVFFRGDGDYSGIIRLAYIAAFPILLTLPERLASVSSRVDAVRGQQPQPSAPPQKRYTAEPKTMRDLLAVGAETTSPGLNLAITRAISQTMLADVGLLVYLNDAKQDIEIVSGYDLIREKNLEGGRLHKDKIPLVTHALRRGKPLRLPASSTSPDIKSLFELLGLNAAGDMLSVPIVNPGNEPLGGFILLSPYSNRMWNAEDQAFLINMVGSLMPIMQRSQQFARLETERRQSTPARAEADVKVADSESRNNELALQLAGTAAVTEENVSQRMQIAELTSAQEQSARTIAELRSEISGARSAGRGSGSHAEVELAADTGHDKSEQAEGIASLSQELRQPISSIMGYADLLLGESVGILGALQRKFIERIKASAERMGSLTDDMIQLNSLEAGIGDHKPAAMDLNLIIDAALAYTSSQIREKNISIHLDLPKMVAAVSADREALQQILIHLLQNAGAAAPVEGTIGLKVQVAHDTGQEFVMIQVTDSGGGIREEDLARVFTRLSRADNVHIQGVGDTGVGLLIAKTLTEAQNGRIWVESEAGVGATFSVLLPVVRESADSHPAMDLK